MSKRELSLLLQPTSGRILVRPDAKEEKRGGVYIPESVGKRPLRGTVVAVGGSRDGVPVESSVGDVVYYAKSLGQEVELGGVPHLVLREVDEVFLILKAVDGSEGNKDDKDGVSGESAERPSSKNKNSGK